MKEFDVVVIGGGPGGYVAAIKASQLGKKVALIEENHLGGICLNWGCIPTKALLRSAEIHSNIKHAEDFGIKVGKVEIDFEKVIKRSRDVASQLSSGIAHLMKKNKIEVFDGRGTLNGKSKIKIEKDGSKVEDIKAKNIILATGARAKELPGLEADGKNIWTYKNAMTPKELPKSILVVGSGAIGVEFASFYNNLGVNVTIVEVLDRILPVEDKDVSLEAKKIFENQGIDIETSCKIEDLKSVGNSVEVKINGKKQKFDKAILAIGIIANSENLGLEGTAVKFEKNHILVDEFCQTDEENLYAIGDLVGAPWLAHKASHEAIIAVEKICGKSPKPLKKQNIPGCTYCSPQIASVGYTEEKALEEGYEVKTGRFPYIANGKAIALGETEGFVKTIFDKKTGELLGAHIIGAEATEMIQGFVIGKTIEAVESDFAHVIFPHPTLSEMMHEAVLDADNEALHI